ncbi:MAG: pirin family protein [Chloroherpetonaceae bacterium]|nr:pirin family protein [Chloroherpetonaceae bacterium]MDW8437524.1 pirin family protein [Chloroherpetonaceae bacterium]
MKKILHRASERGFANYGWLKTHYSFSFANYYDPNKMNFGALRVLNDDVIKGGTGFGTHPHQNMEIVTIPLSGALAHKDSLGNSSVIRAGETQIMSAGRGIEHSEFNPSPTDDVTLLQIWVLPKTKDIEPRYEQKFFPESECKNRFQTIVSPDRASGGVWINQDAWFSLGDFDANQSVSLALKSQSSGVYLFVIDGAVEVGGETLKRRDAIGVWDIDAIDIKILEDSKLLAIEVPMN